MFKLLRNRKLIDVVLIILVFSMIIILVNSYVISIDHQDKWILSGVEISYVIFTIIYVFYFYFEDRIGFLVLFSTLSRLIYILIPNIKYSFFLGRSIDQHMQYNLANYIISNGFIADKSFQGYSLTTQYYTGEPLLHLFISLYSTVLNMPLYQSIKFLPILWNVIYPLMTYYIIKNTNLFENNKNLMKYALFISSIPISATMSYIVTGSTLSYIIGYCVFSQILIIKDPDNKNYKNIFLYLLFTMTSIFTHSLFMLYYFILIIISVIIYYRVRRLKLERSLMNLFLFNILINITWISYQIVPLDMLTSFLRASGSSAAITPTFFKLTQKSIISVFKVIMLYYGSDLLISLFMFVSVILIVHEFLINKKYENTQLFLSILTLLIWILTIVGFFLGISNKFWERNFRMTILSYPFLFALFKVKLPLSNIYFRILRKDRIMLIVFSLISISSLIQFYDHPYFIPSAQSVFPEIDPDIPLVYRGGVNTIYQRHVVETAEKYIRGSIACDAVTRNQIRGLTDREFSYSYLLRYYPPDHLIYTDLEEKDYNYLITHFPGIGAVFEESAIVRSNKVITELFYQEDHDNIYMNGQSFILKKIK